MELTWVIVGAAILAVVVGVAVAVGRARARGARQRLEQERRLSAQLAELQQAAGSALVRVDERLRLADDEVGFAIAEFGENATADFRAALVRARQRLSEAFHLNQLLSDHVPDSEAQQREWNERIVALCESAESALTEQSAGFADRRATVRRTPSEISKLRHEIDRVRGRIPAAAAALGGLAERYSASALTPVAANVEQTERLLEFAERSLSVAQSRLDASRDSEADTAVRAAAETVGRAETLLAAVDSFEVEALHAEATLGAMIAESHAELAKARGLPERERGGRIDAAIAGLEQALAALPAPGARVDPVGSLSAVRSANTALDDAVAELAERAERRERLRTQLATALDDAERQIAAARELVVDYRAPIGPDARTRLAAAERELAGITDERDPEQALARARRAASLAAEAGAYARADLDALHARGPGGWGPAGPRFGAGPQLLGGVIGGLAIGGLLDGIGDLGDFGDFGDFG